MTGLTPTNHENPPHLNPLPSGIPKALDLNGGGEGHLNLGKWSYLITN
jgi:hypothetical protein